MIPHELKAFVTRRSSVSFKRTWARSDSPSTRLTSLGAEISKVLLPRKMKATLGHRLESKGLRGSS